jgi:hypothetical protein
VNFDIEAKANEKIEQSFTLRSSSIDVNFDIEAKANERIAEKRRLGKVPDPGSGGEDEHVPDVCYLGNLEPAADDAGADVNKIARAEVAEARGGGAGEALDEEVEGGGWLAEGGGRRGGDGEEDGVGRGGEAEGEELAGGGVGGEEAPVRGEVEGDVEERGIGRGRADRGDGRLSPVGWGLGRGRGIGGERRGGEEAEVVLAEAARRGAAQEHRGRATREAARRNSPASRKVGK